MLKKENRLTKKKDFDKVYQSGKKTYSQICTVIAKENSLSKSRFGVVITKKTSQKATERNKIRRQIRSIIMSYLNQIKTGCDFVILVSPLILNKKHQEIEKNLVLCLKKQNLLIK